MIRLQPIFSLIVVCTLAGNASAQDPPAFEKLRNRAKLLIPDRSQLRFQEIPWVHDLAEAQKIAQEEKRPIFLWGYGGRARPDNGLEGC